GPYELTVTGKNTVTLKDVLVGEVWVCSGQSNMEWTLKKCDQFGADAIANAQNSQIRLFTVRKQPAPQPLHLVQGEWKMCTPAPAADFSAVGYFFGRDLQKSLGVPVGLIHTSWGGTPAQAWTSKEALEAEPALRHYPEELAKAVKGYSPERANLQYEYD